MNKTNKSLFLVLTDGKPGHETQSDGVVRLLKPHSLDNETVYLKIKKVPKGLNIALRFLLNYFQLSSFLEKYLTLPDLKSVDMVYVISAGGDTLVPNVLLTRYFIQNKIKVKNIILSSLRGVQSTNFNAVFTINSELENQPNFFYYPISPNKMVFKANEFQSLDSENMKILVLIGADTKDVKIGTAKNWFKLVENLKKQYPCSQIMLTTSRRTRIEFEKELFELLMSSPLTMHDHYHMYNMGNQVTISDLILSSSFVIISQDSGSMVSEAIMGEKKTLLVGDSNQLNNTTMQNYFKALTNSGLLAYVDFNETNFESKLEHLTVKNHSFALSNKLQEMLKVE